MKHRRHTRGRGFTLVEVVLGLAVSAMVLAAAAALAFAVSHAWSKSEDVNELVSHGRNGLARVCSRLREAEAVGYTASGAMLIWRQDSSADGQINLSELTLFRLDGDSQELREGQLVFPLDISEMTRASNDGQVTWSEFVTADTVKRMQASSYYREGAVSSNVTSLTWLLDEPPPQTGSVQMQMTVSRRGLTQTLCAGMTLRAGAKPEE